MFIAYIGGDGLVHRVASALFEKQGAAGTAFCQVKGNVKFAPTEVITCEACRASIIKGLQKDLESPQRKKA